MMYGNFIVNKVEGQITECYKFLPNSVYVSYNPTLDMVTLEKIQNYLIKCFHVCICMSALAACKEAFSRHPVKCYI